VSSAESGTNNSFFEEFLDDYFAECDEHLTAVRRNLLALEPFVLKPNLNRSLLEHLFRSFHSLKGISAMVGVQAAEQLAHSMESYLRVLRQDEAILTPEGMDALFVGAKLMEQIIAARREQVPPPDISSLLSRFEDITSAEVRVYASSDSASLKAGDQRFSSIRDSQTNSQTNSQTWRFEFKPAPALAERGINVNTVRARLDEIGQLIQATPSVSADGGIAFEFMVITDSDPSLFASWRDDGIEHARAEVESPQPAPVEAESAMFSPLAADTPRVGPSNVVRVDLAKLDALMRMVGEMVISRSRLAENLKRNESVIPASEWRDLQETNLALERQLRDLREGVMQARMIPVGEIFERMQFVVRDLTREEEKSVRLELTGRETEIDKFLVERMMDPLLHLVRNSVSHGIEPVAERTAQGKPPEGRIALKAYQSGEMVCIEIEDDGRGINAEFVKRRAVDAGLIHSDEIVDSNRILDLICTPGFSTREEADRASGRGVGMAVVRDTVFELGGELTLETEVGRGSRFLIQLPLTLAIAEALIVLVGGQRYAVPLSAVNEVFELDTTSITVLENNEILYYRGNVLPVIRLTRFFKLHEQAGRSFHALVAGNRSSPVSIVVDRILGQSEIVVRAINDPLIQAPGISGATELGDGRIVLIIDVAGLIAASRRTSFSI
jgi:two-component system chemotaxis sensor kinase CheA